MREYNYRLLFKLQYRYRPIIEYRCNSYNYFYLLHALLKFLCKYECKSSIQAINKVNNDHPMVTKIQSWIIRM